MPFSQVQYINNVTCLTNIDHHKKEYTKRHTLSV